MSETKSPQGGLTRRSFLKTTAAVAGATALAGGASLTALADEAAPVNAEEQIFSGCCRPNCEQLCHLNIHVREGKVVRTSMAPMPDECYNRICIKGLSHVQRIYGEDRLKYPMKRVGERGSGEFERISWEEAIDTITENWKSYDDKRAIIFQGGSNYGFVHGPNGAMKKLFNGMGTSMISQAFDCNMVWGFFRAIGFSSLFWNTNEFSLMHHAKNIIIWGGNITESQTQDWHFVSEAQENGTHLTVIDPVFTTSASKADQWIPIRPASDTAMILAMIKLVIDNDWIDHDFAKAHTGAPFLVKSTDGMFLRMSDLGVAPKEVAGANGAVTKVDPQAVWDAASGSAKAADSVADPELFGTFTVNGIEVKTVLTTIKEHVEEFTLARAEELTTVKPEVIEELTKRYALEGPSTIYPLFGPDRYENGINCAHALGILASLTGNIGKPGAACGLNTFWANMNQNVVNTVEGSAATTIAGPGLHSVMTTQQFLGKPYPQIKSFFYCGCNSLGNDPDQNRKMALLDTADLVVCVDFRMTDTAMYSDIVLPASFWFEVEDVGSFGSHPYLIYQEKAIDPLFESKPDFEIAKLLADKMGMGHLYEMTEEEYLEGIFASSPVAQAAGINVETLKREKVMRHTAYPVIYGNGGQFKTASGRAELYCEKPSQMAAWGQEFNPADERLPKFVEPLEAWHTNPLREKYPYHLLQEHTRWRAHTQWSHVPILRELDPEPILKLCPADAAAKGVVDGDYVKVFNDRGMAVAKAVIDASFPSGIINLPKGWQRDQYKEGGFQELSPYEATAATGNAIPFDTLVDFEKYEEA